MVSWAKQLRQQDQKLRFQVIILVRANIDPVLLELKQIVLGGNESFCQVFIRGLVQFYRIPLELGFFEFVLSFFFKGQDFKCIQVFLVAFRKGNRVLLLVASVFVSQIYLELLCLARFDTAE